MADDDDEYVDIVHEPTHGTAHVRAEAFEMAYKSRGWKKASEEAVVAEEKKAERAAARREG